MSGSRPDLPVVIVSPATERVTRLNQSCVARMATQIDSGREPIGGLTCSMATLDTRSRGMLRQKSPRSSRGVERGNHCGDCLDMEDWHQ